MAFAKKLGRLKQVIGEKVGSAGKTEYDDTFKEQITQTVKTSESIDRLHDALEGYLRALRKSSDVAGESSTKILLVEVLGLCIHARAEAAGRMCIEVGQEHEKFALLQKTFIDTIQATLGATLDEKRAQIKEHESLKVKLEGRRLDYDNKHNSVVKAKKEKPELEEALRIAREKYDQTLDEATELMQKINGDQEAQIASLKSFVDAELNYHSAMTTSLKALQAHLSSAQMVAHEQEEKERPSSKVEAETPISPPRRTSRTAPPPHEETTAPPPATDAVLAQHMSKASLDDASLYHDAVAGESKPSSDATKPNSATAPPPIMPRTSQIIAPPESPSQAPPSTFRKPPGIAKFSYLSGMKTPTQFQSTASLNGTTEATNSEEAPKPITPKPEGEMSTPKMGRSRHDLFEKKKDDLAVLASILPCNACDCQEYSVDRFKGAPHCNSCYHKHPQTPKEGGSIQSE